MRDPVAGVSALQWSVSAMSDTTERLPRVRAANQPRAFAVIGEAVWWVTILDATLVRAVLVPVVMKLLGAAAWWNPFSRRPVLTPLSPLAPSWPSVPVTVRSADLEEVR